MTIPKRKHLKRNNLKRTIHDLKKQKKTTLNMDNLKKNKSGKEGAIMNREIVKEQFRQNKI